jgi:2-polyprenyl-3-methyl-5-hydroxy-6-metoxy-1,4-benzoquinol methylase
MYDIDYYKQINEEESEQADRLADVLMWAYSPKSVLDIGSATGLYLKLFLNNGVKVTGIDSSPSALSDEVLQIPKQYLKKVDITKKPIGIKADLSLCIEVMEHIDESQASISIRHITQTSNRIFFTAGQPGQGGVGHVNLQPKSYWEALFFAEGFQREYRDEDYIRIIMESGYRMGRLINNMMIFTRQDNSIKV